MTDRDKHIEYWKTSAIDDLEAIDFLLNGKKICSGIVLCASVSGKND